MASPLDDLISEDYVATLLKKDARESNQRYSVHGLDALLPKRWVYSYLDHDYT